jgi:hypothetical protein
MWGVLFAVVVALFSSSAGAKRNAPARIQHSPAARSVAPDDVVGSFGAASPEPCMTVGRSVFWFLMWAKGNRVGGEFFNYQPPLEIAKAVTPECHRLIASGGWPALGRIVPFAERDDAMRGLVCALDPPEAASRFATWIGEAEMGVRSSEVGAACAAALFRRDPRQFDAVVGPFLPRLDPTAPPRVPWRTFELAMQLDPMERAVLLPALKSATRAEAENADRLRELVCEAAMPSTRAPCSPSASTPAASATPARLWLANLRRAIPPRGWAALFLTGIAVVATTLRRRARRRGLQR